MARMIDRCPRCSGRRFQVTKEMGRQQCQRCKHIITEFRPPFAVRFEAYIDRDFFQKNPFVQCPDGNQYLNITKIPTTMDVPVLVTIEPLEPWPATKLDPDKMKETTANVK